MLIKLAQLLALLFELVPFLHQQLLALHQHLHFVFHSEDPLLSDFRKSAECLGGRLLRRQISLRQIEKWR